MMLAGIPVLAAATTELADIVRAAGADELADRLEQALADEVKLLALTIDERAVILASLDDPPQGLSELRAVLLSEHQWRQAHGSTLQTSRSGPNPDRTANVIVTANCERVRLFGSRARARRPQPGCAPLTFSRYGAICGKRVGRSLLKFETYGTT